MNENEHIDFFQQNLLEWSIANPRPMPWKGVKDPYRIWLSEIILQQTRVEQGWAYYERLVAACPDVFSLANIPEGELMKLWEGLGYYSRARNLQSAARYVAFDLNGKFPESYAEILRLKGVGPYTAAAISSFAFDLPHAVLDGNVFRVLSRFFGIDTPIDSSAGKSEFGILAAATLLKSAPATYNQAIMDLGALQCTPRKPDCNNCPMRGRCIAFQNNAVEHLPVKEKKLQKKRRFFHYFILVENGHVWIERRDGRDIWQSLYQFPLIETEEGRTFSTELSNLLLEKYFPEAQIQFEQVESSELYTWQLTHQTLQLRYFQLPILNSFSHIPPKLIRVKLKELENYAFPRVIDGYLREKNYL